MAVDHCFPGLALHDPPGSLDGKGLRIMVFTCIEMETRRRMLGLSQADLGVILGLLVPKDPSDPKPVGQQTISRWEEGVNGHEEPPYWVQSALPKVFDRISEIQEALFRRVLPFVESLESGEDGLVHVPMYRSDRAFARALPKMAGWPASLWNSASLRAVDSLDDGREYQFDLVL